VPLTGEALKATYTISTLKGAPNEPGAEAFVAYLLGPDGQAFLKQDGFDLITPPKTTAAASRPRQVRAGLASGRGLPGRTR